MPARIVVSGKQRHAQPAFDLYPRCNRAQKQFARGVPVLGNCQCGGHHGAAWMDERGHVHIVVIERVGAHAIHERRIHHVQPLPASGHRRLLAAAQCARDGKDRFQRLRVRGTERATNPIGKGAARGVLIAGRQLAARSCRDEIRTPPRHADGRRAGSLAWAARLFRRDHSVRRTIRGARPDVCLERPNTVRLIVYQTVYTCARTVN